MNDAVASLAEKEALDIIRETMRDPIQPRALYLFGSRSAGTARPDSDYDILAVVDEPADVKERVALSSLWRGKLARCGLDVEILVKTPAEIAEYRNRLGSLVNAAMRTGIAL